MEGEREGVTIRRVSSSLSTWVPVNPPLIPPDSQLAAPSEWRAALGPRNFPPLSVSQSWLEITGLWWKHRPLHPIIKSISTSFSLLFLVYFFIYLIPTVLLVNVINFHLPRHRWPYSVLFFFFDGRMTREMNRRKKKEGRAPSWVEPEWCHGGICPPGVEASLPLLITLYKLESDMADMRPKYNYCGLTKRYWDSGNEGEAASEIEGEGTRTAVHAHTHAAAAHSLRTTHTHTQTQPLVLPLHSLR